MEAIRSALPNSELPWSLKNNRLRVHFSDEAEAEQFERFEGEDVAEGGLFVEKFGEPALLRTPRGR